MQVSLSSNGHEKTKETSKYTINYLMPECSLVPNSYSLFPYFL